MNAPGGAPFAVALLSAKGGVGKTTTAVNLAYVAAEEGRRALVWDLDPQGATTFLLGATANHDRFGTPATGAPEVWTTEYDRLDVVGSPRRGTRNDKRNETRIDQAAFVRSFATLSTWYDVVVFDCAAGLDAAVAGVLSIVDVALVPLLPSPLGVRTLDQLEQFLEPQSYSPLVLPFFSMVDRRRAMHRQLVEAVQVARPQTLSAQVVDAAIVERMGDRLAPVVHSAPESGASVAYRALWAEVCDRFRTATRTRA
jgi:cellulose biosynthesis protein BcsQ